MYWNVFVILHLVLVVTVLGSNAHFAGLSLFFGNLHSHTSFSDGRGTPEQAYQHAKRFGNFLAVTDHCYYLGVPIDGRPKLLTTLEAASKTAVPGKFVGLVGFEWTAGSGHINVYDTLEFVSRNELGDLMDFYRWLVKSKKLGQFNHPGVTFGNFQDFIFVPEADEYMNLIEIGNGSQPDGDTINDETFENFLLALNRGWHVAPTANQDNHRENWLSANETRTGVWARELTYDGVMEALWNRRTFATEDSNVIVWFEADGWPLGSVIQQSTQKPVRLKLYYRDDEPVSTLVLYSQSGVLFEKTGLTEREFSFEFDVTPPDGYEWYFVYIKQPDGDEIVTAPIWLEAPLPLKVNYVRTWPKTIRKNAGATVVYDLYNVTRSEIRSTFVVKLNGQAVKNETLSIRGLEVKYGCTIELSPEAIGTPGRKIIDFEIDGIVVQSYAFDVFEKTGPTVLVDKLHENELTDALREFLTELERAGGVVVWPETLLAGYDADIVLIPGPTSGGLDFFKEFLPEEEEWLRNFQGKIVLLRSSDAEFFEKYRSLLPNAVVVETVEGLYDLFSLQRSGISLHEGQQPVVLIDQGHSNDYYRDKLTKLEAFLTSSGFVVSYAEKLEKLSGRYLIIMNGKGYSEEERRAIAMFVRNGGTLIITSKSDYRNGGNTEDLNQLLDYLNASVYFNDDQVEDEVSNYGAPYKVVAGGVRFYSPCSLIVLDGADALISSNTARSVDTDGNRDARPVDKVVLAAKFKSGRGTVYVLGKAVFSDYDFDHNRAFVENVLFSGK